MHLCGMCPVWLLCGVVRELLLFLKVSVFAQIFVRVESFRTARKGRYWHGVRLYFLWMVIE